MMIKYTEPNNNMKRKIRTSIVTAVIFASIIFSASLISLVLLLSQSYDKSSSFYAFAQIQGGRNSDLSLANLIKTRFSIPRK